MHDTDVLIAGAGPTGLVLGIDLARRGIGVRIVDRAEAPPTGSRGDGLQPRTLEVFDDLGVLDRVLAAGMPQAPVRAYIGGSFAGEHRMSPLQEPTPAVPYPNAWVLGQAQTEGILRERLAEWGVTIEMGTELVAFEQDSTVVTATLVHGGGTETVRSGYLVGADGGSSTVRKALGIPFHGTTDGSIRMLLGDVGADGLDHTYGYWFATEADPMTGIALSPLPGSQRFQFGAPIEADVAPTLAALQAIAQRYAPELYLRDLGWATVWRPNVRLAARFRQGRVLLAGDAAHVHPPTGGQGLNTGVQDAYNLGWKLAAGDPVLLDSYDAERRAVAARVLGLSSELLRKYLEGEPDAHQRGDDTRQLGISYAGGPLADRSATAAVRSGDRAPDAPVTTPDGTPSRLFELFRGPHATVLEFGGGVSDPGEHRYAVRRQAVEGCLLDADGHAFTAYGAREGTVVHVRPDGYIGRIAQR